MSKIKTLALVIACGATISPSYAQQQPQQNLASPADARWYAPGITPAALPRVRNGLPPTTMDSFVKNAGAYAEAIFGDEGAEGLPPYEEFTPIHRLNVGITGTNDLGLTTGHTSYLPSAWGGDEFVDTEPFTKSGPNYGTYPQWATTQGMPLASDRQNPFHGYSNWWWDLNDFRTRDEFDGTRIQRLVPGGQGPVQESGGQ